jgi:hypothetical protein
VFGFGFKKTSLDQRKMFALDDIVLSSLALSKLSILLKFNWIY